MDLRAKVDPIDRKWIKDKPDEGFSPERNKAIVDQTIKEYEAIRANKLKSRVEEYAERSDAVVTYLKALDQGRGHSNLERFFGKKMLAHLRGQEIRDQLMSGMNVLHQQGEIITNPVSNILLKAKSI
jgi:hypothetical protein